MADIRRMLPGSTPNADTCAGGHGGHGGHALSSSRRRFLTKRTQIPPPAAPCPWGVRGDNKGVSACHLRLNPLRVGVFHVHFIHHRKDRQALPDTTDTADITRADTEADTEAGRAGRGGEGRTKRAASSAA